MKCVAFITPTVTVIAHSSSSSSLSARLPAMQSASTAYRPPVVALSVQRQQHELGADVTALVELSIASS